MGMAAHVIVASHDQRVFAHLHPSGSISMAALQKFTNGSASTHVGHVSATASSAIDVPYAFPAPGRYRIWVQYKRSGAVQTTAFDVTVRRASGERPVAGFAGGRGQQPLNPLQPTLQ